MSLITTNTKGNVLVLTLNRPDKFNSFIRAMAFELQAQLDKAANDTAVRAILITGEGKAFCAGQDLGEAISPDGPAIERIVREHYNPIVGKIRSIAKPVVAAVNGVAAGAGANIALACDVAVAGESASFIQAFSKIGLIPDSGGTFFLPRLVGFQKASALMMLGDKVNAADALQLGMLYKVFPDAELQAEALKIAETLGAMPTKALAYTKQLLNESMTNSIEQQLEREEKLQAMSGQTADYKEGVNAFLEKRKAVFTGS